MLLSTLLFAAFLIVGTSAKWEQLHVKYAPWDGFYDIPLTLGEINDHNPPKYVKMSHDERLNVDLYSYPDDPRFSILIDTHGNIAGLRTAYLKSDVGKRGAEKELAFPYNFDNKPMFTSGNYHGKDLWYTTVLFVSPDKLRAGGRTETHGLVGEGLYLNLEGNWTKISQDECKVEAQGFTKQACYIGMGQHYNYKITPNTKCEDVNPVFLLFESGKLIGLGINPFGTFTYKDRIWFEDVPVDIVKEIIPNGPECLTDWVSKYGATSIHIFFKRFPRLTICTWPWQKSDRCQK